MKTELKSKCCGADTQQWQMQGSTLVANWCKNCHQWCYVQEQKVDSLSSTDKELVVTVEKQQREIPQEPQSETPRTEAFAKLWLKETHLMLPSEAISFARTLERELGEAKRDVDNCRQIITTYADQEKDLVELFNQQKQLQQALSQANERITILEKECQQNNQAACLFDRDTALAELAQVQGELVEAQQWLDSEPDWKNKFMASYLELQKERNLLAKQNYRFREVLELVVKTDEESYAQLKEIGITGVNHSLTEKCQKILSKPDTSSLTVLTRAEVEKLPCGCKWKETNNCFGDKELIGDKCPSCLLLERFTK